MTIQNEKGLKMDEGHVHRAHSAVVGGSSASRVMRCPGSVPLSKLFPEKETSDYAEEGTALHEAVEHILVSGCDKEAVIGKTFNNYEITQQLFDDAIEPAIAMLSAFSDELNGSLEYVTEARVAIPEIPGAFGTVDLPIKASDRGVIWDWKFGAGVPVEAEQNAQMMFYAHGARSEPKLADMFPRDKPVEIVIAQPRMPDGFRRWVTDHEQLDIFVSELVKAVEVAEDPLVRDFATWVPEILKVLYNAPLEEKRDALEQLSTGLARLEDQFTHPVYNRGSHCRWCKAKKVCPLMSLDANKAIMLTKEDLQDDLPYWLEVAGQLKGWIDEIEKWAYKTLDEGGDVPGYKLVAKSARRKWDDETSAFDHFSAMRSVKADEFAPRKMLTVAQMDKLLKKKNKSLPEELVVKESSGNKMVPESAPGEPVNLTAAMMEGFGDFLDNT